MYYVTLSGRAEDDLDFFKKSGAKKTLVKIFDLLDEIAEHPFTGTAHPEPLKGNLSGCWSRKLDKKNRMVYKVNGETIEILVLQLRQHYGDK